jgi:hypothetical protein
MGFAIDMLRMRTATIPYPAAPTFFGAGAYNSASTAPSIAWPAGHQTDDVGFLLVHTNNQALPSTPTGCTLILGGTGAGTAAGVGGVRMYLFWIRATSGAMASISVADSGNITGAQLFVFRGCRKAPGLPYEAAVINRTGAATTAVSILATTALTGKNRTLLAVLAHARDLASTANLSGWANGSTSGMNEIGDTSVATSNGGGLAAAYGFITGQTTSGVTTATLAASVMQEYGHLLLVPDGIPAQGYNPVGQTTSVADNGVGQTTYTITASGPVVWNWTVSDATGFISSVANGGSASSITFSLSQGTSDRTSIVQVTSGDHTWNINMSQTGDGGGGVGGVGVVAVAEIP